MAGPAARSTRRRAVVHRARPLRGSDVEGGRDADPRQQTLRAAIDWSYDLLTSEERRVFRVLSVFTGGCTLEAAEEVVDTDPETLQSLLDKSLLRRRDTELGP